MLVSNPRIDVRFILYTFVFNRTEIKSEGIKSRHLDGKFTPPRQIMFAFVAAMEEVVAEGKNFRLLEDSQLEEVLDFLGNFLPDSIKVNPICAFKTFKAFSCREELRKYILGVCGLRDFHMETYRFSYKLQQKRIL